MLCPSPWKWRCLVPIQSRSNHLPEVDLFSASPRTANKGIRNKMLDKTKETVDRVTYPRPTARTKHSAISPKAIGRGGTLHWFPTAWLNVLRTLYDSWTGICPYPCLRDLTASSPRPPKQNKRGNGSMSISAGESQVLFLYEGRVLSGSSS